MEYVIFYFSKDGNTRAGAKILGERIKAEIVELKEKRKSGFIGAVLKRSSRLEGNPWQSLSDAKEIYVMSPVWASNGVPAMNAFLEKGDFAGKDVNIVTFQLKPEDGETIKIHNHYRELIEKNGGNVKGTFVLQGAGIGKFAGEEKIALEIDKVYR